MGYSQSSAKEEKRSKRLATMDSKRGKYVEGKHGEATEKKKQQKQTELD